MDYVFGAYRLDTQRYELTHAGVPIPLRPKVFQVLAYLLGHHERVVSKEELLEQLWPNQFAGDVGLNSYIMAVRTALRDRRPPHQYLRTVRGHGYRFVAEVTTAATYEMGELYRRLGADLMKSERPANLDADALEQYDILLEEQAFPFEEKAVEVHSLNARHATGP